MASPMRIRATNENGVIDVKVLMRHAMETGLRKGPDGKEIPAWYIETVEAKVGDKTVFTALLGPAVSKDPFLNFKLNGSAKPGDELVVTWKDNKGESRTDKTAIK
ncbi:MAG: thiosulfate oxidation carrier complex protein SoxZ [Burkholderiaceae bacterium]|nr:thiosulfate oxidation carrier complex protein SoxZ [Burkholderiaceae bacterium]MCD8517460.1 thiosulfate oxidation carrier complex protein SoxZ [Burkholderiaceae bacterium]MCD8537849.1 thiosulfate oxidation carrier complex protein SoxZ [Burkholderiaceae bacterium]MCD8566131.1 thiosulfate oxidation carrier complex protein SoxZ [Burkholderiaceae bacterium]